MAREQVAGEQDENQVRLVAAAALVDHAHAVGVAVVGDPEVGAHLRHLRLEGAHGLGLLGVGQVVREAPVRLAEELDHLAAEPAQQLGRVDPGHAVAGVDDHLQASGRAHAPEDGRVVVLAGRARLEPARARLEVTALDHPPEGLDLVLAEGRGAGVHHLDAVVLDRVVAARDVGAAVELPVGGGEVHERRGRDREVDDGDAGAAHPSRKGGLELGRREAVILADGDRAAARAPDQRAVRAPDLTEDVWVDVRADAAADVVRAEDVRV